MNSGFCDKKANVLHVIPMYLSNDMMYDGTGPTGIGDREAETKLLDMQIISPSMFFLVLLFQLLGRNRRLSNR